jgi:two-component system nitrate/nitrite response regulator NarL
MLADQDRRRPAEISEVPAGVRVLVVSPVRLLRDGLTGLLQRRFGAVNVCTAAGAESAVVALHEFAPTLILLDVATDDGLAVARTLSASVSNLQILGFAARAHDHDLLAYAKAGITGFITREASTRELFDAISRATRGEMLCSPRLAATLFRKLAELATEPTSPPSAAEPLLLTEREREIVCCIDEGLSNKQIARDLRITVSTVKNHVHNILEKLHVTRRGEAAARIRVSPAREATKESPAEGSIVP